MALLWLLLRVRWRRALAPSLAVALLIGAIGGFVLASAAAARRVENAYSTLVAEIDAPDIAVIPVEDCGNIDGTGCTRTSEQSSPDEVLAEIRASEVVEKARLVESVIPFVTDANGNPILGTIDDQYGCIDGNRSVQMVAAVPGSATDQVVPFRLEGKLPTSGSSSTVLSRATAERAGLSIGDSVLLAGWCDGEGQPVEFATPIELQLSGLSIGPLEMDPPGMGLMLEPAYVDPVAFDAMLLTGAQPQQNMAVWLDPSASSELVRESLALASFQIILDFRERKIVIDDALSNDANLLWLLAAVGALGGLLVLAPLIARNLRDSGPNAETLSALGTRRPQMAQQAIAHAGSLGLIGALSAALVAVPISALMPTGFAATIQPHRNLWLDGSLTIIGVALLATAVVAIGAIPSWRIGKADRSATLRLSESARVVPRWHLLRPAARTGVLAAVGTPAGPRRASPWPSLLSMVVAAVVGAASLTYLAGLRHLEQSPALLGWNWDAMVSFDFDQGDPTRSSEVLAEIEELDSVEQVTAGTFFPPWFLYVPDTDNGVVRTMGTAEFYVWPWSFDTGPDAIRPTVLSGRAPEGPDEMAVDALFAEQVDVGVGDIVPLARPTLITRLAEELTDKARDLGLDLVLEVPEQPPVVAEFEITGIALLASEPGISNVSLTFDGYSDIAEPDADEIAAARAWLPADLPPELLLEAEELLANLELDGRVVYLRFFGSVYDGAGDVMAIEGAPEVVAPSPADVLALMVGLNIESNDRVPVALSVMVAIAFILLASYLLFVTVRARRFEIAVMRALGFSTRGVRWSVAAQATATVLVVLILAIPIGFAIGRWAWLEYARDDLGVLPVSVVPWSTLAIVCGAAIVLANVAALVPGWLAARRSPGYDLRSE